MTDKDIMKQPSHLSNRSELRTLLKQFLKEGSTDKEYSWESRTTENGLPHNWIYDLYQDRDGRIYVSTWGGGLGSHP